MGSQALPVTGEKAACTPCQAPLDVPQNVDQKGAIDSFSTGVSCSLTCTCAMQAAARPLSALEVGDSVQLQTQAHVSDCLVKLEGHTLRGAVITAGA